MVTEFFTAFLRARGTGIRNWQILKNTREEVLHLNTRLPWRRSPLWLLVRVALQLVLRRLCVREEVSDDIYKHFMVYYMSTILETSYKAICDENRHAMQAKVG